MKKIFILSIFILFNTINFGPASAIMNGMEANKYANGVVAISSEKSHLNAYCSGAYLQPHIVATAAHCVVDKFGKRLQDIYTSKPGSNLDDKTEWAEVAGVFFVDGWKNDTSYIEQDDIAFLTIRKDFGKSVFENFADLEMLRQVRMGDQYVWHLGYGMKTFAGKMSNTPQLLGLMPHNGAVTNLDFDSFIRTTGTATQNTCPGDSGGPAFSTIGGRVVLLGVLTGGNGCTQKSFKEYVTTSFSIQYYSKILEFAITSINRLPELPTDFESRLNEGSLLFTWTLPRTINDESLTKFEILINGAVVCSSTYERKNPYFSCKSDAVAGKNEIILKSIGMNNESVSKNYLLNIFESQTKKGILEAKVKAEAEAKVKAEAEAKVKAEAEAKVKAEAEAKVKAEAVAAAISSAPKKPAIKKITCIKGKISKLVTGANPKCPSGYKLK